MTIKSSANSVGRHVHGELGAIDEVAVVLGLTDGTLDPSDEQAEAAAMLRTAARLGVRGW